MPDRSEALVRELARELEPVRRVPRLRTVALAVAGAFALGLAAQAGLGGPLPLRVAGMPWGEAPFLLLLAALLLGGAGCLLAALGSAVPGRGGCARAGRGLAAGGLLAVGVSGALAVEAGEAVARAPAAAELRCALRAGLLGLVPALVVATFLARALARHPRRGALLAAVGAVGLGAAAVHASCGVGDVAHRLLGHGLLPVAAGLALSLPLALRLARPLRVG